MLLACCWNYARLQSGLIKPVIVHITACAWSFLKPTLITRIYETLKKNPLDTSSARRNSVTSLYSWIPLTCKSRGTVKPQNKFLPHIYVQNECSAATMNLQSQLTEGKRVQLVLRKSVQIKALMCARVPAWHEVEGDTVCSHWWQ